MLSEIAPKFSYFKPPVFFGGGAPTFVIVVVSVDHRRTRGEVWWQSAKRPMRLCDKSMCWRALPCISHARTKSSKI